MWDDHKRSRLQQLRQRQGENGLCEAERTELASLVQELEAAESTHLSPATQRLRHERETIETQNRALEGLAIRKKAFVQRLRDFVAEAQAERQAIDRELAAVLAAPAQPTSLS